MLLWIVQTSLISRGWFGLFKWNKCQLLCNWELRKREQFVVISVPCEGNDDFGYFCEEGLVPSKITSNQWILLSLQIQEFARECFEPVFVWSCYFPVVVEIFLQFHRYVPLPFPCWVPCFFALPSFLLLCSLLISFSIMPCWAGLHSGWLFPSTVRLTITASVMPEAEWVS